jgi:hypothetical protein
MIAGRHILTVTGMRVYVVLMLRQIPGLCISMAHMAIALRARGVFGSLAIVSVHRHPLADDDPGSGL